MIINQINSVVRIGDGVTTVFDFPFIATLAEHIVVYYLDEYGAKTKMDPSWHITTLGVSSGTVAIYDPHIVAAGQKINIVRETPATQLVSVSGQAAYDPKVTEGVWDKITQKLQELEYSDGLSVKVGPADDTELFLPTILAAAAAATEAALVLEGLAYQRTETFLATTGVQTYPLAYDPGPDNLLVAVNLGVLVYGVDYTVARTAGTATITFTEPLYGNGVDEALSDRVSYRGQLALGYSPSLDTAPDYTSIAAFNAAIAAGLTRANGRTVTAGGSAFAALAGSTVIGIPLGYQPAGEWTFKHFGAVGDGVTDDADAIERALNSGHPIVDDGGTYLSSRTINVTKGVAFLGANQFNTSITFTAGGLNITPAAWTEEVFLDGFLLLTQEAGLSPAIQINRLVLGTAGLDLFSQKDKITNVSAKGVTATTTGWKHGILHDFPFGMSVIDCYFKGSGLPSALNAGDFIAGSAGIYVPNQATRTLANVEITNSSFFNFYDGLNINNVEALDIHRNDIQVCYNGVVNKNPLLRVNQHRISLNHIGVSNISIDSDLVNQLHLLTNEISYRFGRTGGIAIPLVRIRGVVGGTIVGGTIRGNVSTDTDVVLTGIDFGASVLGLGGVTKDIAVAGVSFTDLSLMAAFTGISGDVIRVSLSPNVNSNIRNTLLVDYGAMADNAQANQRLGTGPFGMSGATNPLTIASQGTAPLRLARAATGYVLPFYSGATNATLIGGFQVDAGLTNLLLFSGTLQVVGARKTGWALDTGTAKRTANATYSATANAAYVQADIQTLMNVVRDLSQTVKALKDDLHGTAGHGLIGT